jgi:dihydropteroate synthase
MHTKGNPKTMQREALYADVVSEVGDFLVEQLARARAAGVHDDALCADPGIGFAKLPRHNLELLARLPELVDRCGVPVLVGPSRKSFIGAVLGEGVAHAEPLALSARDDGTLATVVLAVDRGARVVRVHDARPAAEAVRLLSVMSAINEEAVA